MLELLRLNGEALDEMAAISNQAWISKSCVEWRLPARYLKLSEVS
jgi:hypothetical protein